MEQLESQGALDCREHQVHVDHKEMWGLKDRKEMPSMDCRDHQDHVGDREVWGLRERKVHKDLKLLLWVELRTTGGETQTVALECSLCMQEGLEVAMLTMVVAPITCACQMIHNTPCYLVLEYRGIAMCMELNMNILLLKLVIMNTILHVLYVTFLLNTQLS